MYGLVAHSDSKFLLRSLLSPLLKLFLPPKVRGFGVVEFKKDAVTFFLWFDEVLGKSDASIAKSSKLLMFRSWFLPPNYDLMPTLFEYFPETASLLWSLLLDWFEQKALGLVEEFYFFCFSTLRRGFAGRRLEKHVYPLSSKSRLLFALFSWY